MPEEDALLEEIISKINERFDGIFSEGDRVIVETLYNRAKENKKLNRQAQKNDEEVYTKSIFPEVFRAGCTGLLYRTDEGVFKIV